MQEIPNNFERNEESLKNLALALKIPTKYGWQKALAETLGVGQASISKWIKRGVSKHCVNIAKELGHPPSTWLIPVENYKQGPQHMLPGITGPDDSKRLYGQPDFDKHFIDTQISAELINLYEIAKKHLLYIFASEDDAMITAIRADLLAFKKAVERQEDIVDLKERVKALERNLAENSGAGPQNGGPTVKDAGNADINMDDSSI